VALFDKQDIADAAKPELHPEGTFRGKIVATVAKRSKSGKDMIRATFRTNHGKVDTHFVWSPESKVAKRIYIQDMAKLGIADLSVYESFDTLADDLLKAEALISVAHEEHEGNTYASIKKLDTLPTEPVADDEDAPQPAPGPMDGQQELPDMPPPPGDEDAPEDVPF